MPIWRCSANPCPRYDIAARAALGQSVAGLVVMRNGQAFCSNCNAPQNIAGVNPAVLPPDTPDTHPQPDYATDSD